MLMCKKKITFIVKVYNKQFIFVLKLIFTVVKKTRTKVISDYYQIFMNMM